MTKLLLVGEAYGQNEAAISAPFVGASGIELLHLLDESGIISLTSADTDYIRAFYNLTDPNQINMIWNLHPEISRTNVFNLHPPGNDLTHLCGPKAESILGYPSLTKGKYVRAEFAPHLEALAETITTLRPNLILALGNTPLWALCACTGISKLRGAIRESTAICPGTKLLPTYHPSAVLRQWELRPVTALDFQKANREKEYPDVRRPEREIWIEPSVADIREFTDRYIYGAAGPLSVDIETAGTAITCIGFAPSARLAIVIPFTHPRRPERNYWENPRDEHEAWRIVGEILADARIKKLFQNGTYDIAFLHRSMGLKVYGATEDTMLLHHALQPESLKGLGFLGSVYCDEGAWKADHRSATIKRDA